MSRNIARLQERLLGWFLRHQRAMPWRAPRGRRPDPYHVWLSEIMLQQTTVAAVGSYFIRFVEKWPTVKHLAAAQLDEVLAAWAGLGYYARARNLHKCAQAVAGDLNGRFPGTEEELLALPGIGPYTAAAIASIAFNRPAVAVDGNVERVVSRFYAIEEPLPQAKAEIRARAARLAAGNPCPGDFTQAFMELGATVCTPRKPKCGLCPWQKDCLAFKQGIAGELPRRAEKAVKPIRYGKVFWIQKKDGTFLIEKRNGKGLYEGLYQLPTTEWVANKAQAGKLKAPCGSGARFKSLGVTLRHSFTHFDLVLEIWGAISPKNVRRRGGIFVSADELEAYALPSLMRKAVNACIKPA